MMNLDPTTVKILHEEKVNQVINPKKRTPYQLFTWSNFGFAKLMGIIRRFLKLKVKKTLQTRVDQPCH